MIESKEIKTFTEVIGCDVSPVTMFLKLKTQFPASGEDETAMMEIPQ